MRAGTWMILAAIAAGCSSTRWERIEPSRLPGAAAFPKAQSIVLLDDVEVRFQPDPETGRAVADYRRRFRIRYLDPDVKQLGAVNVYTMNGFSRLVELRARTIRPDGESADVQAEPLDLPVLSSQVLFNDSRRHHLEIPPVPAGGVVEYDYTVRYTDMKMWQFRNSFGDDVPVRLARLTVTAPIDWDIDSQARQEQRPFEWQPEIKTISRWRTHRWERRDIQAFDVESNAPSIDYAVPHLAVRLLRWTENGQPERGFATPEELSAYLFKMTEPATAPSPEIAARVKELVAEAGPDPEARARRIHKFVCEEVQYCAIEIGYGGWIPHRAADVFKLRYGDCKDKANLLRTMLEVAGIPSRLGDIYAHDGVPRRFGMPTIAGNFNHVILLVDLPGGTVFTDPTAREVPFGELPPSDIDADVLPIEARGAPLVRSPGIDPSKNGYTAKVDLSLDGAGTASGTFTVFGKGSLASRLRAHLLDTRSSKREEVIEQWLDLLNDKVESLTFKGLERGSATLEVSGRIKVTGLTRAAGSGALIRVADILTPAAPVIPGTARKMPYVSSVTYKDRIELTLRLPPGMIARPPEPVRISSEAVDYQLDWAMDGSALKIIREVSHKQRFVPAPRVAELKQLFDRIHEAQAAPAILRTATAEAAP